LLLDALPPRLAALLAARKGRRSLPFGLPSFTSGSHVLDRTASFTE
jgi:hypothetical protein